MTWVAGWARSQTEQRTIAASSTRTLQAIYSAAFRLFFKRGYTRVSMDEIAAEAGLTKRTLYYHFDSKDALIGAAMDHQADLSLAAIQTWSNPKAKTPAAFLDGMLAGAMAWSATPNWTGSGFTRLSLELADLAGHPARVAARAHKDAIQRWIAQELAARGSPSPKTDAETFCILLEGALVLTLISGDTRFMEQAREAASQLSRRLSECHRTL